MCALLCALLSHLMFFMFQHIPVIVWQLISHHWIQFQVRCLFLIKSCTFCHNTSQCTKSRLLFYTCHSFPTRQEPSSPAESRARQLNCLDWQTWVRVSYTQFPHSNLQRFTAIRCDYDPKRLALKGLVFLGKKHRVGRLADQPLVVSNLLWLEFECCVHCLVRLRNVRQGYASWSGDETDRNKRQKIEKLCRHIESDWLSTATGCYACLPRATARNRHPSLSAVLPCCWPTM